MPTKSSAKKPALTSKLNTKPTAAAGRRNEPYKERAARKTSTSKPKGETKMKRAKEVNNHTITKLTEENPKRGTAKARYDLYKDGMTVQEYIEAGGLTRDLKADLKLGHIKLTAPEKTADQSEEDAA